MAITMMRMTGILMMMITMRSVVSKRLHGRKETHVPPPSLSSGLAAEEPSTEGQDDDDTKPLCERREGKSGFHLARYPEGLEESPISVYGNAKMQNVVPPDFERAHPTLFSTGRSFEKVHKKKAKEQTRLLKLVWTGAEEKGTRQLQLSYSYQGKLFGRGGKMIPLQAINSIRFDDPRQPRGFIVETSDRTYQFNFPVDERTHVLRFDEDVQFVEELMMVVPEYNKDSTLRALPSLYDMSDNNAKKLGGSSYRELTPWARDVASRPLYWLKFITKDKVSNSIAIDFNRFTMSGKVYVEGTQYNDPIEMLDAVFGLFGDPLGKNFERLTSLEGTTQIKTYIEQRSRCEDTNALAVLLAGVQQLVINLEKAMQSVLFLSHKGKSSTPQPLALEPSARVLMADGSTKNMVEVNMKLKNSYADRAVEIRRKEGGALVSVTRDLALTTNYGQGDAFASVSYTITVDVTFDTVQGPSYKIASIALVKDLKDTSNPRLDDDTRAILSTRVDRLNELFSNVLSSSSS